MILLNQDESRIVDYIKKQIQAFLLEMDDFYPFGAEIKKDGTLTPLAAYLNEDELSVQALISSLEQAVAESLLAKNVILGAVAIAVNLPEFGENHDGVQIRFYKPGEEPDFLNLRYRKVESSVEFY